MKLWGRNKVWGFICIEVLVEIIRREFVVMRKIIKNENIKD